MECWIVARDLEGYRERGRAGEINWEGSSLRAIWMMYDYTLVMQSRADGYILDELDGDFPGHACAGCGRKLEVNRDKLQEFLSSGTESLGPGSGTDEHYLHIV